MKTYFVTGTDTDVGKTVTSCAMLAYFKQQGVTTAALKPLASGCQRVQGALRNADALALQAAITVDMPYEQINPIAFEPAIAPHIAATQCHTPLSVESLQAACSPTRQMLRACAPAITLIEGAGGWLTPLNNKEYYADWVVAERLPVILVVGLRLGCLNHTLLTVQDITRRGLTIAGWVANIVDPNMACLQENVDSLRATLDAPCLGVIPYAPTPEQVVPVWDEANMNALLVEPVKRTWHKDEVEALFELPLMDCLFEAQRIHRQHFNPNAIQASTLLSIKTGACPEDCGYCSQSGHHSTALPKQKLLPLDDVLVAAKRAKDEGATRFCMGGAWRSPPEKDFPALLAMVEEVKALGLETCVTAGMLSQAQAGALKAAGLDYYNHNIDTSPEYYAKVITTRTFADRLNTLDHVRNAGINVCCGGILGLGETRADRISMLCELANLPSHPESVPINQLVAIEGTPLSGSKGVDPFEFIRVIAVARILMPRAMLRLSAGRKSMSDEMQALCFFAGANSIFYGDKLLTVDNPEENQDKALLARLGMHVMRLSDHAVCA